MLRVEVHVQEIPLITAVSNVIFKCFENGLEVGEGGGGIFLLFPEI